MAAPPAAACCSGPWLSEQCACQRTRGAGVAGSRVLVALQVPGSARDQERVSEEADNRSVRLVLLLQPQGADLVNQRAQRHLEVAGGLGLVAVVAPERV